MTSIQSIIRTILQQDSAVAGISGGRIYDLVFPPGYSIPAATLQRISETIDALTLAGTTTLQIDAYARTHTDAANLAEAIRQSLTNYSQAGDQEDILSILPQNTVDFYTADNRLHRVSTDYAVTWRKKQ